MGEQSVSDHLLLWRDLEALGEVVVILRSGCFDSFLG